jgi:predicted benzoate:H+ symporter BenE
MVAVIGIVVCAYVAVRMLEIMTAQGPQFVQIAAALTLAGALVGAVLIWIMSRESEAALNQFGNTLQGISIP